MDQTKKNKTFFDSPERLPAEEIQKDILRFRQNSIVSQMLEGFPDVAVIINQHRQIVALNTKASEAFRTENYLSIIGKRVGEAINCIHWDANENGCGTSNFCRECGAARAIKKTIDQKIVAGEECRISVNVDDHIVALDFYVHTQPFSFEGITYTIFSVRDISSVKRRETLERIFFHDILNTAHAVKGLTELLPEIDNKEERTKIINSVVSSARQLLDEIQGQSALSNAEEGHLEPNLNLTTTNRVLKNLSELYQNNPFYADKILKIVYPDPPLEFFTDASLVVRSLGNLIKNALESSAPGEEVTVFTTSSENEVVFHVLNNKVIPEYVQLQLFQRSFSTKKSKGHGIGLYSVRLIVNQYLKGRVEFKSNDSDRTIFSIHLPKNFVNNS